MLTGGQRDRYLRHVLLKDIGSQGQQALLAARILVIGAGGIGSPLLQYLAAAGFGHITIIDPDRVELSNLQRQTIFREANIGELKVLVAKAFCKALNSGISIDAVEGVFCEQNAASLMASHDLVIEGVDSFEARYLINDEAIKARIPFISAAVGRFEGHLSLFDPTGGDFPCYRCFVPEPPPRDEEVNCLEEGVVGALTGVMGALAAMEAIKATVGIAKTLRGALLVYDGLNAEMRRLKLPRDKECAACGALSRTSEGPV